MLFRRAPSPRRWAVRALFVSGVLLLRTSPAASPAAEPVARQLQGTWEGVVVGDKSGAKYTIKVDGSSFHFHRDTNFWFETTIQLPPGTNPQQLRATIKKSAKGQESSLGKVVVALLKIEGETLTLVARGDGSEDIPEILDETEDKGLTQYRLHKVMPAGKAPPKRQE